MKKLLLCIIVLLAFPAVLADISVMHFADNRQDGLYINVRINTDSPEKFDLAELIPLGWQIDSWKTNTDKVQFDSMTGEFMSKTYSVNHWKFDSLSGNATLSYRIIPDANRSFELISVWFYPHGFSTGNLSIKV